MSHRRILSPKNIDVVPGQIEPIINRQENPFNKSLIINIAHFFILIF
ncbi:MAG: hypothetical protein Q8P53_04030 [Candidatus Shapirobacteria bacterium]|nr:hypothetical protein [Candidatus Shapirobacteria bacterium]